MSVDEVPIFGMVLHTRTHTAPHTLVHLRVDAVSLWAQRGEIDVSARLRVLRRQDMIPHRILIEVGIHGIVCAVAEHLRQFQHVVRVTALRSVKLVDVSVGIAHRQEVLVHAVSSDAHRSVSSHILPEVLSCLPVGYLRGICLIDTLETDILRHLCVGMLAVEERGVHRLHAVNHCLMTEPLCRLQVFLVSKELVGIEQRLVHSSMLTVEEVLKVIVADLCDEVHTPVCQFSEQLLCRFILAIEVGVTKPCQHLVLTIERHPSPVSSNLREVSSPQCLPRLIDGLTADESVESRLVVVIPVLTVFQDGNHVFEPFLHLFLHCCIVIGSVSQRQG